MVVEVLYMDFFSCCVLYITRFPDGQCREEQRGEENWSSFTLETREGTEEEAQRHELFTGRRTLWQIVPPQNGGRGGDRRETRGASQQSWFLFVASGFVASSTVLHLLALLPLSLPGLSGRSVGMWLALFTPGRADGLAFPETKESRQEEEIYESEFKESKTCCQITLNTSADTNVCRQEWEASLLNTCGEIPIHNKKKSMKKWNCHSVLQTKSPFFFKKKKTKTQRAFQKHQQLHAYCI